jgi:hypothetical protein
MVRVIGLGTLFEFLCGSFLSNLYPMLPRAKTPVGTIAGRSLSAMKRGKEKGGASPFPATDGRPSIGTMGRQVLIVDYDKYGLGLGSGLVLGYGTFIRSRGLWLEITESE